MATKWLVYKVAEGAVDNIQTMVGLGIFPEKHSDRALYTQSRIRRTGTTKNSSINR